jgi:hypothetical protein
MDSQMRKMLWTFLWVIVLAPGAWANNLQISNVTLEDRNQSATTAVVEFDITWDNSWRNTTNHDAVWVVFKIRPGAASSYWCHAPLKTSGLNPAGTSTGTNSDLEIFVPTTTTGKNGAFIRRKSTGSGTVVSQNVRLVIDYGATGGHYPGCLAGDIISTTYVQVRAIGVEMVFIPTGPFDAGSTSPGGAGAESSSFYWFSLYTRPWQITSEGSVVTPAAISQNLYYTQVPTTTPGNEEPSTGNVIHLPPSFPKGYAAIYAMKYEITEGLYVDFINLLDAVQKAPHDVTCSGSGKKATTGTLTRNTVTGSLCGGGALSTSRPDRGMGYLSWITFAAMMDWLALRPMTELEYEKMSRGPTSAVPGEFAWGTAGTIRNILSFDMSPEDGTERAATAVDANVNIGNAIFTEGDVYLGSGSWAGPVRAGMFATSSSTRALSGAGYYGNMELTGNLWEYVVSVSMITTRSNATTTQNLFNGVHGDGELGSSGSTAGLAGGTTLQYWPGAVGTTNVQAERYYVIRASGAGLRGASFSESSTHRGRTADRYYANLGTYYSGNNYGGRGVRTYDGTDF